MSKSTITMPSWVPVCLDVAAAYNLAWGAFVILFPLAPFHWIGLETPNYPPLLQCLGMVIGVYGIGYWIAARDAATHWPIVLVGLLGKIFGPIGFVFCAIRGELPWSMAATIVTNDVVWWLPFTAILVHAARLQEARRTTQSGQTLEQALRAAVLSSGQNLYDLSFQSPLLLVCVRHLGCTFCRETLADLARQRDEVARAGLIPVVVFMGSDEQAVPFLKQYALPDVSHVSDPQRRLFQALELPLGSLNQVFGWSTFWRGLCEGALFRFGIGKPVGHILQLSGAFIIRNGRIERALRHEKISERTDFAQLSCDLR